MVVQGINPYKYNVKNGLKSYVVNLKDRTCSCRSFDLDLMPCSHAVATISFAKQSIYSYIADFYKMDNLREMYLGEVISVLHPDEWVVPPKVRSKIVRPSLNPQQAGRPRSKRISSGAKSSSGSRRLRCSRCGQVGHNRVTCTTIMQESIGTESGSCSATQATSRRAHGPK
ncbi:hypothetical protein PTKIN_Ptkin10aG0050100 [Pterospermum kingtungense]